MSMKRMSLEVEFLAGTDLKDAIKDARNTALKLGLGYVKFNFNGIKFSVGPNAFTEDGLEQYHDKKRKDDFIVVN